MRTTRHFAFAGLAIVAFISIFSAMSETKGAGRNLSPDELWRFRGGQQVDEHADSCCTDNSSCIPGDEIECKSFPQAKCTNNLAREWPAGEIKNCVSDKAFKGSTCKQTKAVHACYISYNCVWNTTTMVCDQSSVSLQINAPDLCSDDCP